LEGVKIEMMMMVMAMAMTMMMMMLEITQILRPWLYNHRYLKFGLIDTQPLGGLMRPIIRLNDAFVVCVYLIFDVPCQFICIPCMPC